MQRRYSLGIAAILLLLASGAGMAWAWEPVDGTLREGIASKVLGVNVNTVRRVNRAVPVPRLSQAIRLIPMTFGGHLATITSGGPGHLAALDARQQLRDQVCIAMADGGVSRYERQVLLTNAKNVLTTDEYLAFQQSVDGLTPQMPVAQRHPMVAKLMQVQSSPTQVVSAPVSRREAPGNVEIVLTEHVASSDQAR
jgi:hypothetical protein